MSSTNNRISQLMSADDVAAVLALSVRSVRRLIEAGDLRAHHLGRAIRISQEDLNTYIAKCRK